MFIIFPLQPHMIGHLAPLLGRYPVVVVGQGKLNVEWVMLCVKAEMVIQIM